MTEWTYWLPFGACVWLAASAAVAVFLSRTAALAELDWPELLRRRHGAGIGGVVIAPPTRRRG